MGVSNNDAVRRALRILIDHGFSVNKINDTALYLIRVPEKKSILGYRYSTRFNRFTKRDTSDSWPEGTEIAKLDNLDIPWEPIFPQNKGSQTQTDA